ncbi:hypothetical protein L915_09080 [Phytophthora nicotianae]|uniref:Uncharacterized protein n=1 Tax=Phytophthora nicotianae TaxID=4792 RepID=W2J261_PHYNI|nr:hypothetical protein L915_09080 [Phytophthora nicotianae]ETL39703.1 hypothetical protein L916_08995 [Phytophthora nicotianae]
MAPTAVRRAAGSRKPKGRSMANEQHGGKTSGRRELDSRSDTTRVVRSGAANN